MTTSAAAGAPVPPQPERARRATAAGPRAPAGHIKLTELNARQSSLDEINEGYQNLMDGKNIRGIVPPGPTPPMRKDRKERPEQ